MQRRLSALWIVVSMLALSAPAFAQEEGDISAELGGDESSAEASTGDELSDDAGSSAGGPAKPISAALLLGYGLDVDVPGNVNPFGVGFGVRGGYNLDEIYLGARFQFFLGASEDGPGFETSLNIMKLGLEGGYDVAMDKLTIRPKVGLGLAIASGETTVTSPVGSFSTDASSTDLYIALGGAALYDVADDIFIGGELDLPIILANSTLIGLEIMLTGGMRF